MAYKRKTRDEYTLQGLYSREYGFEDLVSEDTRHAIYARLKEYRENEPGTPYRIIKRRIKIEGGEPAGEVISTAYSKHKKA